MSLDLGLLCGGFLLTGYTVGALRRGNVQKHVIGASQIDVITRADAMAAFEAVKQIRGPYRVDDSDAGSKRLVLSSSPTIFSWGFLYPIEIAAIEGGSKVTVGIMSKFLYGGLLVTPRAHERCARTIEALFAMPPMRVA